MSPMYPVTNSNPVYNRIRDTIFSSPRAVLNKVTNGVIFSNILFIALRFIFSMTTSLQLSVQYHFHFFRSSTFIQNGSKHQRRIAWFPPKQFPSPESKEKAINGGNPSKKKMLNLHFVLFPSHLRLLRKHSEPLNVYIISILPTHTHTPKEKNSERAYKHTRTHARTHTHTHTHTKRSLCDLSPRANYTDRATVAFQESKCQLLQIEGATWSAWRIPTTVI
jgi:hypothetical protein